MDKFNKDDVVVIEGLPDDGERNFNGKVGEIVELKKGITEAIGTPIYAVRIGKYETIFTENNLRLVVAAQKRGNCKSIW